MNEQEHIIETFSEMAMRYEDLMNSELRRFWGINYYEFIQEVLGEINTDSTARVLDVATGTAFIPRKLIENKVQFKNIIGLDLTFEMLLTGQQILRNGNIQPEGISFVCASAHCMPFAAGSIDNAICCLATHHMNVDWLLSQLNFSLKPGSPIHIGDVGGSARWKIGMVRTVIKLFAFLYFLITENFSRARAESDAVANVMTSVEWRRCLEKNGFEQIQIEEVRSKKFWAPNPVRIKAKKILEEKRK